MATYDGVSYIDPRNINLRGGARGSGVIRFDPTSSAGNWSANPIGSTAYGIYVNTLGQLVYSSLGSVTVLGAAGGPGTVPSWNTIFGSSQTLSVQGIAFTIQDTSGTSNNVLSLVASSTSGALLTFAQSGSGNDILGTSSSWSVSKAGAAAFLSVASATINGAGAGITIGDSGSNVVTIGTNSNTITMAKATTFSSTITGVSQSLVSASNTVVPLLVTNNTITTFGHGVANGGVAVVRSTSLTTGTLVRTQAAEGTLTTGFYFEAWDTTGSNSVFSVAKTGAVNILGSDGNTVLTIQNGDIVCSGASSLTMSDNDNGGTLSLTNNTSTTGNTFLFTGSGVFTGTGTSSFLNLTQSGLTTGTAMTITTAALTSGIAFSITANALTTGSAISVLHTTSVIADGGSLVRLSSTSIDTGTTTGNLLNLSSTASTAGTLALITGNALTTGIALSVSGTGVYTGTGFVSITQSGATTGTVINVTTAGLTTGTGIKVTGNALTTGALLSLASSSTSTTNAGAGLSIALTGAAGAAPAIKVNTVVQSTHFRLLFKETNTTSLWISDGTTAQGNLSGTAGDICFNAGSNKPEYCTGTTSWTALV